jgi:hypothetical protein
MPEDSAQPLKHLTFKAKPKSLKYSLPPSPRNGNAYFERTREEQARRLKAQIDLVKGDFEQTSIDREAHHLSPQFGKILNISSEPDHDLSFDKLGNSPRGKTPAIVLLNLRREETPQGIITKAAIYVPHGQLKVLSKKIESYSDPSEDNRDEDGNVTGPSNAALLNNIASISVAAFDALWTDPDPLPAGDFPMWFELWIRRDRKEWKTQFEYECAHLELDTTGQTLALPEHFVVVLKAARKQLESSLDLLNTLSEIRIARPCSVGLTDLSGLEQEEWLDIALDRIQWPSEDAPAVCLIDSGVNRGHALIEPLLSNSDSETVFSDGDRSDDLKHGTPMAGLAAFGDLNNLMLSSGLWRQLHRLESVKLIRGSTEHDPDNYGSVTLQAVALPEIQAAKRKRVFCMAVTRPSPNTEGNPSAWSSAIDMAVAGSEEGGAGIPRVIIISAGNFRGELDSSYSYPKTVHESPIEDPAQAWNAVTVGAITNCINIKEDDDEARRAVALAPDYGLCPFSRTADSWRSDWPISPDIVMEGGNLGKTQDGDYLHIHSLKPLSTNADFRIRPLMPFNATSAATAQAARVAAMITERYPEYRAETIRGLLVHSARWPEQLLAREKLDPHKTGKTSAVEKLMRSYGYGVVDEKRAIHSLENKTTFVVEGSIQPFKGKWNDTKLNECHLIQLPWPSELLRNNPDHSATLRVTLSYFIEPNPGSRTWEKSQKYHYASSLLRFQPKHRDMPLEEFKARLDAEGKSSKEIFSDPGWAVGGNRRKKAGSLVQDIWKGTTAELADMGHIGIYPAKGWWAYRDFSPNHDLHGSHLKKVNYSLIVSLETDANLQIYTEVAKAISAIELNSSVDLPV